MPETMDKVRQLREMRPTLNIQVDGGLCTYILKQTHQNFFLCYDFFLPYIPVAPSTVDIAAAAGANMIVAGSAIFKHVSPREVMSKTDRL